MNWTDAQTNEAGKEILEEIMYNPKSFRMGDIFYKIQEKIDKNVKPENDEFTKQQLEAKAQRLSEWHSLKNKNKTDESSSDDGNSTKAKNEEKYELAEKLKARIKADPTYSINAEIFYDKNIVNFCAQKGLEENQRVDGVIMPKTNIDDLVKYTLKHYKNIKKVKEGNREARMLQAIFKGNLTKNPEFVAKKNKERRKTLLLGNNRNSPLTQTNRSLPPRSNLTIDTRNANTVQGKIAPQTMTRFGQGDIS